MSRQRGRVQTETKVTAGSVATALGVVLCYVLEQVPFIAAMPGKVQGALAVLVLAGVSWAAGYLAPHTPRDP